MLDLVQILDMGCEDLMPILKLVRHGLMPIIQIGIPILLIVFGSIDLGKAVMANDDKEIKGATGKLIKRAIAAVVVFFVPTIVSAVFGMLNIMSDPKDFNICVQCLTDRAGTVCTSFQKCALGSSSYDATACGNALTNYYR